MIGCFDIGGSAIKAAYAVAPDALTNGARVATPLDDFAAFAAAIRQLCGNEQGLVEAVSISIAGVVDPQTGRLKCANIPCIDGRAISRDLEAAIGLPVFIANDADCFALAEATVGAAAGHRNVFGVILGTGVGGGLVVDGRIVTGAGGFSGEWGHGQALATEIGTPPRRIGHFACGCGQKGCVDTIGGARGLERLHLTLSGQALDSHAILSAWRDGEASAAQTVAAYLELVAPPLALTLNITGSSIVPVGGGLANAWDLIEALDAAVRSRVLRRVEGPLLVKAALTSEPGLTGAAILGFQARDGAPLRPLS
ncbi:N-acetylglucosamine kinase [Xaviernesmea oryzae]|uniref:N-acetylglucosamine kinase n=1 Tax=Xaviernesmea oryzae TaxID=464029 RepID=A0A1Q9AS60_9HYPH|nr:ROK family protein [Xaviernesmea oryzae]OLP58221.1 N-acetylglucosamine kinase [Xaviernesmea oryzae]SEL46088.1 N-acetylglucosamine kinase [Xaviernesmea oryzae]